MIKNVVFDFNGTILDDVDVSLNALNECIKIFLVNKKPITKKYYLDTFSFPVQPYYTSLGFDFTDLDYNDVSNCFIRYYKSHCDSCKLYDGFIMLIEFLHTRGVKTYILSNSYRALLMEQLEFYKIDNYFDGIIAKDDKFAGGKEEIGKQFFALHPVNANETIIIGDTVHDYEVGKSLGFICVGFSKGHNSFKLLNSKTSEIIIDNLKELIYKFQF